MNIVEELSSLLKDLIVFGFEHDSYFIILVPVVFIKFILLKLSP